MQEIKNRGWLAKKRGAVSAIGMGVAGAACAACCVSISALAPLLAWLGLSGLGAMAIAWYVPLAVAFPLGLGGYFWVRRRRQRLFTQSNGSCGCGGGCKI